MTGKQAYLEFLKSPFWRHISRLKKKQVGRCERCGIRRRLQAHHHTYPDDWYQTKLTDLTVLCDGCHSKIHGKLPVRGFWCDDLDVDNFYAWVGILMSGKLAHGMGLNRWDKKHIRRALILHGHHPAVTCAVSNIFKLWRVFQ